MASRKIKRTTTSNESYHDYPYLDLIRDVLTNGALKENRTGVDTVSVFSRQLRFDLSDGTIPLLTTKKMHTRSIIYEILWYLQGGDNIQYLNDNGVRIWNEWADENGDLGPVYGYQWRKWPVVTGTNTVLDNGMKVKTPVTKHIDQIAILIDTLRRNPNDRRLIVSAWNVGQLEQMRLPPCHYTFQFYVADNRLSCMMNQRSCDLFLGVPFNIVQYSILTRMVAHVTGFEPGEFIWNGGDVHIYENHIEQCKTQIVRQPYPSPYLELDPDVKEIDDFYYEAFQIHGYEHHPLIKAEVAV